MAGCAAETPGDGDQTSAKSAEPQATSDAAGQDDPFARTAPAEITDLATGLSNLSSLVKSFKIAIEAVEREEAEKLAGEMASIWMAVRTEAESKDPQRCEQLHNDLSALLVAVAAKEWDKTLLIDLDYSLYQGYRDLNFK